MVGGFLSISKAPAKGAAFINLNSLVASFLWWSRFYLEPLRVLPAAYMGCSFRSARLWSHAPHYAASFGFLVEPSLVAIRSILRHLRNAGFGVVSDFDRM